MRNINFTVTVQDSPNFAGYVNHTRSVENKNALSDEHSGPQEDERRKPEPICPVVMDSFP